MKQFLVEVFTPRSRAANLAAAERRATRLAREVAGGRYLRATYVPEDETCFYVFEAPSAELVAEVTALAALGEGRIVEATTTEEATRIASQLGAAGPRSLRSDRR